MRYNADIHKLIKSLTKSEKRYFKIYAAQHTKNNSNNYLLLFDAIDNQEVYSEEKLKRKFGNHSFGKKLANTKFLLYELIVKMQLQLRKGKDVDSKIRDLLDAVDFHFSKSLYNQAFNSLQKAKKMAIFFEHCPFWFEALNWERKLFGYADQMDAKFSLKSINKEYKKVKEFLNQELSLAALLQDIRIFTESNYKSPMDQMLFELELIFQDRLITNYKAKTFLSKLYLCEIAVLEAFMNNDFEQTILRLNKMYELWEAQAEKVAIFPHHFIHFCSTYMTLCTRTRQKGYYYDNLYQKMLGLKQFCRIDQEKILAQYSMHDFVFNLVNDNLEVCAIQVFTIRDLIDKKHFEKLKLIESAYLFYHIGVFYFIKKEFREAINWWEKLENYAPGKNIVEIQAYVNLLRLAVLYEERNYIEFEILLSDFKSKLNTKRQIQPFEKLALSFFEMLKDGKLFTEEKMIFSQFFDAMTQMDDENVIFKMSGKRAMADWAKAKATKKKLFLLN